MQLLSIGSQADLQKVQKRLESLQDEVSSKPTSAIAS